MSEGRHSDLQGSEQPAGRVEQPVIRRYWWLKRAGVVVAAIVLLIVGLREITNAVAVRRLHAEIEKLRAAGEPVLPEDFKFEAVPEEENMAPLLLAAMEAYVPAEKENIPFEQLVVDALNKKRREKAFEPEDVLSDPSQIITQRAEVDTFLEQNARCLELFREAAQRPRCDWGYRRLPDFGDKPPDNFKLIDVCKAALVAAVWENDRGNSTAAYELVHDALHVSRSVGSQSPYLIFTLIPIVIYSKATDIFATLLATEIPHLDTAESIISIELDTEAIQQAIANSIRTERAWFVRIAPALGASDKLNATSAAESFLPRTFDFVHSYLLNPVFNTDAIRMLRLFTRFVRNASIPDNEPILYDNEEMSFLNWEGKIQRISCILSLICIPNLDRSIEGWRHARTIAHLGGVMLALRLYERDHGEFPETLAELVPIYMPYVPLDTTALPREVEYIKSPAGVTIGLRNEVEGKCVEYTLESRD